ncbi:MAG TPA: ROK family protein, partial [Blastocatellia bacterium]|nr:ROK family protein [Blastocatellia bacterium]
MLKTPMTTSQTNDQVFIGIDLGGTTVKGALVTPAGEILHEVRVDTEQRNSDRLLEQIIETIHILRSDDRAGARAVAVGIGIPGLVNLKTKRIEVMPNLPPLSDVDVITELSRQSGLPVTIDNDANAAAYAELMAGAARGRRDVFFVTLGTGIGSGLIIDGKIYRGATGFAGEFGHMTIDPEGIECGCGNIGCLETIAS